MQPLGHQQHLLSNRQFGHAVRNDAVNLIAGPNHYGANLSF